MSKRKAAIRAELTVPERWVVGFNRQHGFPFSDFDTSNVTKAFAEFFETHDPTFPREKFLRACDAAVETACLEWDQRRAARRAE